MLQAIVYHSDHLELSEQFDAVTGFEKSVASLSWSYAAFLSAVRARTGAGRLVPAPRSMSLPGSAVLQRVAGLALRQRRRARRTAIRSGWPTTAWPVADPFSSCDQVRNHSVHPLSQVPDRGLP